MAESFKLLARQQIPNSVTTIYTVPADTQAIIKRVRVANPAGSGDVACTLYVNGTAAANQIMPAVTIPEGGFAEDDGAITLNAADTLRALGSVNNALTITVHGVEITA